MFRVLICVLLCRPAHKTKPVFPIKMDIVLPPSCVNQQTMATTPKPAQQSPAARSCSSTHQSFGGVEDRLLEVLVASHPLHNCTIQPKILHLTVLSLHNHNLGFAEVDSELTVLQKLASAVNCFCRPAALPDVRMRSSAYSNSGTIPMSMVRQCQEGQASAFPSTYKPNSVGLSGHPCFTPMRHLKIS